MTPTPDKGRYPSPRFLVVAGPPCSGKTTVARRLAIDLRAPHLEMDAFRQRLLPESEQRVEDRDLAYRAMHYAAELLALYCADIVLDATYTAAPCRSDLWSVVERVGGGLLLLECRVDPAAAAARFERRGAHPAVDLTPGRAAALAADYPYFGDDALSTSGAEEVGGDLRGALRAARRLAGQDGDRWCRLGRPRETATALLTKAR